MSREPRTLEDCYAASDVDPRDVRGASAPSHVGILHSLLRLQPGSELGRYELLAPAASGGMASVWLGRQRGEHGFERLVAVKTILPMLAADPGLRTMFLDEARLAARIRHANVVQVLDLVDDDGVLCIVLEWIDGESLQSIVRALQRSGKKLPLPIALRIMADACRGLHAAHEVRGQDKAPLAVVHRDVSPHNILVDADGFAKIIDFGVAKARERINEGTTSGAIKGKIRYMPPEQVRGGTVDRRTDVWAAGAVLQFLLTGAPPYGGSTDIETVHKLSSGAPPRPLSPGLPAPVIAVAARALALDPGKRFASAEELGDALEGCLLALGRSTTTGDVRKYVADSLGSLAEHRRRAVDEAIEAAEDRERLALGPRRAPADAARSPPPSSRAAVRSQAATIPEVVAPSVPPEAPRASAPPPRPIEPKAIPKDERSSAPLATNIEAPELRPSRRAPLLAGLVVAGAAAALGVLIARTPVRDPFTARAEPDRAAAANTSVPVYTSQPAALVTNARPPPAPEDMLGPGKTGAVTTVPEPTRRSGAAAPGRSSHGERAALVAPPRPPAPHAPPPTPVTPAPPALPPTPTPTIW